MEQSAHFLIASISVLISLIILLYSKLKNNYNYYLGFYFLIQSSLALMSYVTFVLKNPFWTGIFFANASVLALFAPPLIYFYVRNSIATTKFKTKDILHFIPFIVQILNVGHFTFNYDFEEKIYFASELLKTRAILRNLDRLFIFPLPYVHVFRPLLIFCYSFYSLIYWNKQMFLVEGSNSVQDDNYRQKNTWIKTFLYWTISSSLFNFLLVIEYLKQERALIDPTLVITINPYLNCIIGLILLIAFPSVLFGINKSEAKQVLSTNSIQRSDASISEIQNYTRIQLIEQIIQYDCWNDSNLSYESLIETIWAQDAQLAQWIAKQGKHFFNELKNRIKVRIACRLMQQDQTKLYSVEAIGKMSGFSSKSNFYKWFKEVEGITPIEYIRQLGNN